MEWKTTEAGYRVPIYTEEEKRNHIPHWCADDFTDGSPLGVRTIEVPPEELTPELINKRKKAKKVIHDFFAEQEANNQTTD